MEINDYRSAVSLLDNVARMAVNANKKVSEGAGKGFVGILNGMTVKLATHWTERIGVSGNASLQQACEELRQALKSAADQIGGDGQGLSNEQRLAMAEIRHDLGFDDQGNDTLAGHCEQSLITREIALKVVKNIQKLDRKTGNESLTTRLDFVTGEATIKNSKLDNSNEVTANLRDIKERFLGFPAQRMLQELFPGDDTETQAFRQQLLSEMDRELVFRQGSLSIGNIRLTNTRGVVDDMGWTGRTALPESVDKLCNNHAGKVGRDRLAYREALASIFFSIHESTEMQMGNKTVVSGNLSDITDHYIRESPEAKFQPLPLPNRNEKRYQGPEGQKQYRFDYDWIKTKNLALASVRIVEGERQYLNYQSWLLHAAAIEAMKPVNELTMEDVCDFAKRHWNDTPKKLNDRFGNCLMAVDFKISTFMEESGLMCKNRSDFKCSCLDAKTRSNDILSSAFLVDSREYFDSANKYVKVEIANVGMLYSHGGGLTSSIDRTFEAQADPTSKIRVTSSISPLNRSSRPKPNESLSNFAKTEFRTEGGKKLFSGFRFGQINQENGGGGILKQQQRYGELLREVFMADEKLKQLVENGQREIEVPLCRIDMAEEARLTSCASNYTVRLGDKVITLKPKIMHFRIPTDSATLVNVETDGVKKREWRLLSKEDLHRTQQAVKTILSHAAARHESLSSFDQKLVDQIQEFTTRISEPPLVDKDGNLELFNNCGAFMMQFGARLALLADHLGIAPSINCTGGRDRTGLMDVECKTLALFHELNPQSEPPPISDTRDEAFIKLRNQVCYDGGNQEVARMIKLNDHNMYTHQAHNKLSKTAEAPAPTRILSFESISAEERYQWKTVDALNSNYEWTKKLTMGLAECLY